MSVEGVVVALVVFGGGIAVMTALRRRRARAAARAGVRPTWRRATWGDRVLAAFYDVAIVVGMCGLAMLPLFLVGVVTDGGMGEALLGIPAAFISLIAMGVGVITWIAMLRDGVDEGHMSPGHRRVRLFTVRGDTVRPVDAGYMFLQFLASHIEIPLGWVTIGGQRLLDLIEDVHVIHVPAGADWPKAPLPRDWNQIVSPDAEAIVDGLPPRDPPRLPGPEQPPLRPDGRGPRDVMAGDATPPTAQSPLMPVEYGTVAGTAPLTRDLHLVGTWLGDCQVVGARLLLGGTVVGDLQFAATATAHVQGIVNGSVYANGETTIAGIINGDVHGPGIRFLPGSIVQGRRR